MPCLKCEFDRSFEERQSRDMILTTDSCPLLLSNWPYMAKEGEWIINVYSTVSLLHFRRKINANIQFLPVFFEDEAKAFKARYSKTRAEYSFFSLSLFLLFSSYLR